VTAAVGVFWAVGAEVDGGGVAAGLLAGAVLAGGGSGFGAETPAMLEPRPSFCRLSALSLPLASSPLADWNFCIAATVVESHLPLGLPS